MTMKLQISFRALFFLVMMSIMSILIISLQALYTTRYSQAAYQNAYSTYIYQLDVIKKECELKTKEIESLTRSISYDTSLRNYLNDFNNAEEESEKTRLSAAIYRTLRPFLYTNFNVDSVGIITLDEDYYSNEDNGVYSYNSLSYYEKKMLESKPFGWLTSEGDSITFYTRIYDTSTYNSIMGYVFVSIERDYFISSLSSLMDSDEIQVVITNNDGDTYVASDSSLENLQISSDMFQNSTVLTDTIVRNGWVISLYVENSYIDNLVSEMTAPVWFFAILILSLGMIAVFIISKSISSPIKKLSNDMNNFQVKNKYKSSYIKEINQAYKSYHSMNEKIEDLIIEVENKEKRKKIIELDALQSQINPHFLYNTLDSINWMALGIKATNISKMVVALSKLLRLTLNKGYQNCSLEHELEHVSTYVAIQRFRYQYDFEFIIDVDPSYKALIVPKFILQPLVENSLKHAFDGVYYKGIIKIYCDDDGKDLNIYVVDNGIGYQNSSGDNEKGSGYGIYNIIERIRLTYGDNYGVTPMEVPIGTSIRINIPLENEFITEEE